MIKNANRELTHDSGRELNAQGSFKSPMMTIANDVCEKVRNGEYQEFSRCDDYGVLYLTAVSTSLPEGIERDFTELDVAIDNALKENSLFHYRYGGMVFPDEEDNEITIYLEDDRRPSVYWDEECGAQTSIECLETAVFNNSQKIK